MGSQHNTIAKCQMSDISKLDKTFTFTVLTFYNGAAPDMLQAKKASNVFFTENMDNRTCD